MLANYKIATASSTTGLETEVKKLLSEGYQPRGELVVSPGSLSTTYTLFQVMVKEVSTNGFTGPR